MGLPYCHCTPATRVDKAGIAINVKKKKKKVQRIKVDVSRCTDVSVEFLFIILNMKKCLLHY